MKTKDFFHDVRKRSMAHVVEQRCGPGRGAIVFVDGIFFAQPIQHPTHQVKGAKRVGEARMLRSLVGVEAQSELFDAAQPLKLRRVDQAHH